MHLFPLKWSKKSIQILVQVYILLMFNYVVKIACSTLQFKSHLYLPGSIMTTRSLRSHNTLKLNTCVDAAEVKKPKRKNVVIKYDSSNKETSEQPAPKTKEGNGKEEKNSNGEKTRPDLKKSTTKQIAKTENVQSTNSSKNEENSKKTKWEPEHWHEVLANIREMRKHGDAPVDTMGCDQSPAKDVTPEVKRFHVLISLMLSSQTKDEINHQAMCRLKEHGLTIDNICNTPEDVLGQLIKPVGFWKTKAGHIKKTVEILKTQYNNDIPNTIDLLCKLPGVGPKMAHLCMNHAWGVVTGIGVDVHVHRISHRLGWTKQFKTPEHTREELESWLPESLWSEVNHLLVGFGQQICKALRPQCETCLNKDLCPQGKKELAERAKKSPKKPKVVK